MTTGLNDITGGDPRRARVLQDNLGRLAESPNTLLREMAKAVLNGELRLYDAAQSDTYSDALGEAFDTFWMKYQDMSTEEREQLTSLGYQHIERAE